MLNSPPGSAWYSNPKLLIMGGVGLFAAIILLRSQNNSGSTSTQQTSNTNTPSTTTPVGGSYTYLDGSGMQHIIATDPSGNLVGYNSLPPDTSNPQAGQLSSYAGNMTYAGSMAGVSLQPPYGAWTAPYYSQTNWLQYNPMTDPNASN